MIFLRFYTNFTSSLNLNLGFMSLLQFRPQIQVSGSQIGPSPSGQKQGWSYGDRFRRGCSPAARGVWGGNAEGLERYLWVALVGVEAAGVELPAAEQRWRRE